MKNNAFIIQISNCCFLLFFSNTCFSQIKDSSGSSFKISGYADAYYAYYSDSVGVNNYSKFSAVSPKNNAFSLNIFQLTAQYTADFVRATATVQYGDLPSCAWSPVLNMIQEANVGFRLNKKVWIDAGLFKTHIGTEAFLPKDNIASSLSIVTTYEPWFQSGVRLTYTPNDKLSFCLHVLNGYNTFVTINKKKAFGISAIYTIGDKGSIGYYNLLSDGTPDSISETHLRFLNNLVFSYQISKKLKAVAGFDYISQQNSTIADPTTASIYSAILTFRYQLTPKTGVYIRGEVFSDADGFLTGQVLDANNQLTGYKLKDFTAGAEFKPTENSYIRLEGRTIIMNQYQKIFWTNGMETNVRAEIAINTGIWF